MEYTIKTDKNIEGVNREPEHYGELSDKLDMPDLETIKAYAGDAPATVMMKNSDEDKKYAVEITETLNKIVVVKADSFAEAKEMVEDAYYNNKIILTADNYVETNFTETMVYGVNKLSDKDAESTKYEQLQDEKDEKLRQESQAYTESYIKHRSR